VGRFATQTVRYPLYHYTKKGDCQLTGGLQCGGPPPPAVLSHAPITANHLRPGWPTTLGCPAGHRRRHGQTAEESGQPNQGNRDADHQVTDQAESHRRANQKPRQASRPINTPPAEPRTFKWAAASCMIELRPRWLAPAQARPEVFCLAAAWAPMGPVEARSRECWTPNLLKAPRVACQALPPKLAESTSV